MVPDVAKTGHSFRGAFAYYLHDKRQEGESRRNTAERVAWIETRHLGTADPDKARRTMTTTARRADELKAAAGIKPTGRKSTAHVYAYALSWHPEEAATLGRAEMVRAADATLKILGAEEHQALIVCHTDRAHPHVHVIVNRVDPRTGKLLPTSNDFRKLSAWAHEYEKSRGSIRTPARAARAEEAARRRREYPDLDHRRAYVRKRAREAAEARRAQREDVIARDQAGDQLANPSDLRILGKAQRVHHKAAWSDLIQRNRAAREAIYAETARRICDVVDQQKAEAKLIWAHHFRERRAAWREFDRLEKTPLGLLALSISTARERAGESEGGGRGLLSLTLAHLFSRSLRRASLEAAQQRDQMVLAKYLKARRDSAIAQLRVARKQALDRQHAAFVAERALQQKSQAADRARLRTAWSHVAARNLAVRPGESQSELKRAFVSALPDTAKDRAQRLFEKSRMERVQRARESDFGHER